MEPAACVIDGPRGASEVEFAEVMDFLNYVFRSSVGRRPSMGGDYPHLYRSSNARNLRHIRANGRVVSCVAIYPATVRMGDVALKIGGIGGVATDPDWRKQGLAGKNLDDCLAVMAAEDYDLSILWTGINDYYRKWGWEDAGTVRSYFIDRTTINYLPFAPSGEILTDGRDPRVVDGVQSLHDAHAFGVVRDRALTEIMLNIPTRHHLALLAVDGAPVAYIVHSYGERVDIKDWGGDAEAVLGLARIAFAREGARTMNISSPPAENGVARLLAERGFPARINSQGMLCLVNPARILEKFGLTDISLEPDDIGWRVAIGGRSISLRRSDLVKLLFGPERPYGLEHPRLPLPFHYGQLDHM